LLFGDGYKQLRDAFAFYLAAAETTDPALRQEYTLKANLLVAIHEQAGAQHALAALVDQGIGDDGLLRGIGGEIFSPILTMEGQGGGLILMAPEFGSDEKLATGLMQLNIGFDSDGAPLRTIHMDGNIPWTADADTNLTAPAGPDAAGNLDTRFDPANDTTVTIAGMTVGISGGGTVTLPTITGWGNPVEGTDIDAFPISVAEWKEGAGDGATSDYPSTVATTNWANRDQRMWYISNVFQQGHTDPLFFDGLSQFDLVSPWGQQLSYLPVNAKR
jgi:hypothetical protein